MEGGRGKVTIQCARLDLAFTTTNYNISFAGVLEVYSEEVNVCFSVCFDVLVFYCFLGFFYLHDDDNDTMTSLRLINYDLA